MISQLIEELKKDEGWREHAYDDATGGAVVAEGWVTIGYGFLCDARKGVGLPRRVGEYWLEIAAQERWEALMDRIPWVVDQPEEVQLALANMVYNLGVQGLLGFEKMLSAIQRRDYSAAADEALNSRWSRQIPARSQRIADRIRGVISVPATKDSQILPHLRK